MALKLLPFAPLQLLIFKGFIYYVNEISAISISVWLTDHFQTVTFKLK